jgi:3-dehydroquinate dehydratase-2
MTQVLPLRIAIFNGPNLNLLGGREPELYGRASMADLERQLTAVANDLGAELVFWQGNHEGGLIDAIHSERARARGIVINAGGYTHTSIALADALSAVALPYVEVHVTNVFARESYRHHSYLSAGARAVFAGAGMAGYEFALRLLIDDLELAA